MGLGPWTHGPMGPLHIYMGHWGYGAIGVILWKGHGGPLPRPSIYIYIYTYFRISIEVILWKGPCGP